MGLEIERRFLPANDGWRALATPDRGAAYVQGYLCARKGRTVRVRLADGQGFLTVKGPTSGVARAEFEYTIPAEDARAMLALCRPGLIAKTRYRLPVGGLIWEVDEFSGQNAGLVLIEVELAAPDQAIDKPPWVGKEVSGDCRYTNAMLSRHPYGLWGVKP